MCMRVYIVHCTTRIHVIMSKVYIVHCTTRIHVIMSRVYKVCVLQVYNNEKVKRIKIEKKINLRILFYFYRSFFRLLYAYFQYDNI